MKSFLKCLSIVVLLFILCKSTLSSKKRYAMEFYNTFLFSNSTNNSAKNLTVAEPQDKIQPYLQDWLMISSPIFKDPTIFPTVKLISGEGLNIETDGASFRINSAFAALSAGKEGESKILEPKEGEAKGGDIKSGGKDFPPNERSFWFRLSGTNMYYSTTNTDYNVLGALNVKSILGITHNEINNPEKMFCFELKDEDNFKWKICSQAEPIRNKWLCSLQKNLNQPMDDICNSNGAGKTNIKTITQIQPILIIPTPSRFCNENWNYKSNGQDWECDCAEGKAQSPIDLPKKDKAIESPVKPLFQYEEIPVIATYTTIDGLEKQGTPLKLKLFDNTLRIIHDNMGRIVTLDGAIYHAQEIIIHTPAEHKLHDKKYDMEIQIVHYGMTVGDIAKQVVLSFLFEKKAGVYNKFLDDLDIFNLPNFSNKEVALINNLYIPKILYSSEDNGSPMMKPFSFFTYQGSLTAPPCTENTIMYVASKPLPVSTLHLQLLQEALRIPDSIDSFGNINLAESTDSNREVQPLNGRPVFHYDHEKYCGPDEKPNKKENDGHYEKVLTAMTKYFYVSDSKPSGIPGAFVVSDKEALGKSEKK